MRKRTLGAGGPPIGVIGLGCMGMSWGYQESERDDGTSVEVIRRALDLGVDFLDTAAAYGDGHNESLLGRALEGRRDEVTLATKGGLVVDDLTTRSMHRDGTPQALRSGVHDSLRRLRTDVIDLYYLHRVDPAVPVEESWGALAGLVAEGKIRRLGLSEVDTRTADRAAAVHPVAAIQSELSLWTRDALGVPGEASTSVSAGATHHDVPADVVAWCGRHGAAFVPYAPLGRGFLTGTLSSTERLDDGDFRVTNPRFQDEALRQNMRIVDRIRAVGERRSASPAQVAIAWTLAQGDHVVAIPGTKRIKYLEENVAAADVELTPEDVAELDQAPGAVGSRF